LIAEPILLPAVRALPGDGIAGHSPHIFSHTGLADMKAAAAPPAKAKYLPAAVAGVAGWPAAFSPGIGMGKQIFHGCCFRILLI